MRPLLTLAPDSGRIELPIAAGAGVRFEDVDAVETVMAPLLVARERLLAVARLAPAVSDWTLMLTMHEHRFARVALHPDGRTAVVQVRYEDLRSSSWTPVAFETSTEVISFGRLASECDVPLLEAAMWNLTIPSGRRP
ncbi:hypothetical protein [Cellulomonas sp. HZM]|uniref:hypothetical protein n=1 Tax=Cellulomonas sp. HZM TaxID=1454010 RepID=UPI0012DF8F52|nr:hypothetical protein [Cellulomonas sp. HZM]